MSAVVTWAMTERLLDGRERIYATAIKQYSISVPADAGGMWSWALKVVPEADLSDGRWRQVAPCEAMAGNDVGGDWQDSEAYTRRFAQRLGDDEWAVVEVSFYVSKDPEKNASGRRLQRQNTYTICSDLRDIGGSEVWSGSKYTEPWGFEPTQRRAHTLCVEYTGEDIDWNGFPF